MKQKKQTKKYHGLLRRFIFNSLQIQSIKYEELYVLGWIVDMMFLLNHGSKLLSGKYGWNIVYLLTSLIGLAILVWYGKKWGVPIYEDSSGAEIESNIRFFYVGITKENEEKLRDRSIDPINTESISLFINEILREI